MAPNRGATADRGTRKERARAGWRRHCTALHSTTALYCTAVAAALGCLLVHEEEVARRLLLDVFHRIELVDARPVVLGVAAVRDLEGPEELVHAGEQRLRRRGRARDRRHAFVDDDAVGEVGGHDEVVLDDEGRLLRVHDEALDHLGGDDALLAIEVGAGLIDEVDVGRRAQRDDERHALQLSARKVPHLLVHESLYQHRLHDVRHELRVDGRVPDLLVQQHAHRPVKLWRDGLRLVGDVEARQLRLVVAVGVHHPSKHPDERGLARAVLPEHHEDLRTCEGARLDGQRELALRAGHLRVLEAGVLPVAVLDAHRVLRHLEGECVVAEAEVLSRDEAGEEDVDAFADPEGHRDDAVGAGDAVQAADEVGEVVENRQVVLDRDHVRVDVEQRADRACRLEPLHHVQVRRRLVEHVHVGALHEDDADGEALQLAA
mmetsp:Transcript_42404/g.99326  ORF Transcript_42404/g.99326 Transcript_42404/m.99326 type:complete len:433 (-) Transcript_42404:835-2133(-)